MTAEEKFTKLAKENAQTAMLVHGCATKRLLQDLETYGAVRTVQDLCRKHRLSDGFDLRPDTAPDDVRAIDLPVVHIEIIRILLDELHLRLFCRGCSGAPRQQILDNLQNSHFGRLLSLR